MKKLERQMKVRQTTVETIKRQMKVRQSMVETSERQMVLRQTKVEMLERHMKESAADQSDYAGETDEGAAQQKVGTQYRQLQVQSITR